MKLVSKFAGIAAALLMVSAPASATVTTWDYSVTSLFTFATYTGAGSGAINPGVGSLSWGTDIGSGQSSLVVGNSPAIGQVDTYLGLVPPAVPPYLGFSTSLTHNNNPITGNSLTSAVLSNEIILDPFVPNNPSLAPFSYMFNISFTETPNSAPCDVSGSPTPCNDIFVLNAGLLNSSFDYDDGTGISTYFVNIFPTTGGVLSVLEDSACLAAGVAVNCIGFTTPEGQNTTLAFGFTISTEPLQIPEPGMLALLGLGLMGVFVWRRRHH